MKHETMRERLHNCLYGTYAILRDIKNLDVDNLSDYNKGILKASKDMMKNYSNEKVRDLYILTYNNLNNNLNTNKENYYRGYFDVCFRCFYWLEALEREGVQE